jgi:hypothetical protein
MAERFRIDLGFPALYASLSMDTQGITDGVVVYDKEKQQLFYTGSYGGGGGGGVDPSQYLKTASVNLNTITFTKGDGLTFPITVNTGSGGGGGDGYWNLINNNIVSSGSLDVLVSSASLTIDQSATKASDDIFIIKRQGVTKIKVNNEGVFTLMPTDVFPTAVTGGIIYKNDEFYFGFQ